MGERAVRFAPAEGEEFVDVCPLCADLAVESGWLKEGTPTTPMVPDDRRRRRRGIADWLGLTRSGPVTTVAPEPILRRLSEEELAIVEAADLFNASPYRRTVEGVARSLGTPKASILPLSGVHGELVVTVAWELSWYQYRITPEASQPVRLAERGQELGELEALYQDWNAEIKPDGRLVPALAVDEM